MYTVYSFDDFWFFDLNLCMPPFPKEFRDQLKLFEEQLPHVSHLAIDSLLKEHEEQLRCSMDQIRHLYRKQIEAWDNAKVWFMGILEFFIHKYATDSKKHFCIVL